MVTDVYTMVTNVYPMVTDVYPMVAEESSVANPQKVSKIDENIRKMQKRLVGNTIFDEEFRITRFLGIIGSHRCHRLTIGYRRWHRCETRYIAGHRKQS
jgi:hypothetical protein